MNLYRKIFLCTLSSLLILINTGCQKPIKDEITLIDEDLSYQIGIKIEDYETKGTLTLSDGKVSFLHENQNSPLFGMEEIFDSNCYEVRFHDMVWKSSDFSPSFHILYDIVSLLNEGNIEKVSESGGIVEYKCFSSNQKTDFLLSIQKDSKQIHQIHGKCSGIAFEINYLI